MLRFDYCNNFFFLTLTKLVLPSIYIAKCYYKSHFLRWSLWSCCAAFCIALTTSILHQPESTKAFERTDKLFISIPQIILPPKRFSPVPVWSRILAFILNFMIFLFFFKKPMCFFPPYTALYFSELSPKVTWWSEQTWQLLIILGSETNAWY